LCDDHPLFTFHVFVNHRDHGVGSIIHQPLLKAAHHFQK
jgi:hypothetical protein